MRSCRLAKSRKALYRIDGTDVRDFSSIRDIDKSEFAGEKIMWLVFGLVAILFAILNVVWTVQGKNAKWFGFISMSFILLTLCAFYSDGAIRVIREDWGGLMDIMPTMNKALWVCSFMSILINSISLFKEKI